ncbi:type II toxin-antitoxin system RelE/ParE family toxin [Caulobacter sp. BE254]|uniref:type II toxin-antitoxin system RelE/ParE family toxin n=1 Tax=Caulobacter sp. BE254 TaxID=2817720 RepID=UPI002866FDB6|nr:type II toxin-antitoxin system RelE/ParE family toxin [Caulobacter sp. BE254]MDR7118952.1 toxin ParE1/3/4 [Caulobacter sp. BE254]
MTRAVTFAPEARNDLFELYNYIAGRGAPNAAMDYIARLEARCMALADFPEQGRQRDDVRPGLRLLGFERRTAIAFHVTPSEVVIDRIFHGGQDVLAAFET